MLITNIKLKTDADVISLCEAATKFENINIDLEYRHYVIDAKSMLGLLAVDRTCKMNLRVHLPKDRSDDLITRLTNELGPFGESVCYES